MPDMTLTSAGFGRKFVWTEKDEEEAEPAFEGGLVDPEPCCKRCRPIENQERS